MNPERWQAVGDLFEQALEVPRDKRTVWVAEAAPDDEELQREVRSLLSSHEQADGGFFQEKVRHAVATFHETEEAREPGRAGPYRLIRELGRGGMGTVFLAERDDEEYRAQVAVKLVRPGMDTEFILARFRRERQTLARLQHPNIARLLDGGTAENGLPYIVMEFVDGPRLTEYVRAHVLGIEARLRLFLDICSAVDYAHRNFVVHRDLKPGNILVDADGVPKLLDFGICKLLHADAPVGPDTEEAPMTPNYASPEQLRGDPVTPLSDVFSLGVVLYELLTEKLPRRFERANVFGGAKTDGAIPRPGTFDRRLAGDLDNIVMRALESEPERRYQSAAEFADDVRRHLAYEPVKARPPALGYRARKFVRRNRITVGAAAAIVVALAAGLAVSLYEVHVSRSRLSQLRSLADKLLVDVHDAVRDLPGSTRARALIVKTGLQYLDSAASGVKGDPEAAYKLAVAYRKLGDAEGYTAASNLGDTAAALASYGKAMALLSDAAQRAPHDARILTERLTLFERKGNVQTYTGQLRDAVRTYDEGVRLGTGAAEAWGDRELKSAMGMLLVERSDARRSMSDLDGSLHDAAEALRLYQAVEAGGDRSGELLHALATAYQSVGMIELRLNRLQDSLGHARQGVEVMERLGESEPQNGTWKRDLLLGYAHVADVLGSTTMSSLGDTAGALDYYRKAAEIGRKIYEGEPNNLRAVMDYGIALSRVAGTIDERGGARLDAARQALKLLDEAARINPGNVSADLYRSIMHETEGAALELRGDKAGAWEAYAAAHGLAERGMKLGQASSLVMYMNVSRRMAVLAVAMGSRARALQFAEMAKTAWEKAGTTPRTIKPRAYSALGFTYATLAKSPMREAGDRESAQGWLRKSLEAWKEAQSDPAFGLPHRREMREVEDRLAAVEKKDQ